MRREEVEALLHDIDLTADEHKCQPADVTFEIEGDILAALCRRWLAVEDAPVGRLDIVRVDFDDADMVEIVMDPNHVSHLQYERVRIVPDDLGGAGK